MKSVLKFFVGLSLILSLGLAGCNNKTQSTTTEPEVVEPEADPVLVSIAVSGEFKTEYEIGEEFDASGVVVTASYDKGEPKVITEEVIFSGFDSSVAGPCVVIATYEGKTAEINLTILEPEVESHTAAEIAEVFNEGISIYGLSAQFYDIEGVFTGYYLGVNFGASEDDSEENLSEAVYTLASFLPDFLLVYEEEYIEADDENDAKYDLVLVTEDFSAAVELYGYLDEGLLISEIYIYDIAE